jgi:hypothetical protein
MQELETQLAKARFARRHLSKVTGIGLAALLARLTMPEPAQAHPCHCFLKGTRVRTTTGEREVEALAVGDLLPTHFNGVQQIQWIGRYRFTRSDISKPWVRDVLPVRVARSALAPNVPASDLYLSQHHGVFTNGELVRVGSLVNGITILLHEASDLNELEYYHIKFQNHDIVYAEGAPCETLLDIDENAANFAEYLRLYGAPTEKARACIPVLSSLGNRRQMRSHLRSALSPFIDRRERIDVIRDRLDERALSMS